MAIHATTRAVLFDLDGTLLDTAADLTAAMNAALATINAAPRNAAEMRPYATHGTKGMLQYALGARTADADMPALCAAMLAAYQQHIARHSCFFPGMSAVLAELKQRALRWGIVTNKPAFLTTPLLTHFPQFVDCAVVVSGDTLSVSKPHPDPLLYAAEQIAVAPTECIYVGDDERDISAGKAACMTTLVASWGFIHQHTRPETWQADGILKQPENLLDWL